MALLAAYTRHNTKSIEDYLNENVFQNAAGNTISPQQEDVEGFEKYMIAYKNMLLVEQAAVEHL